MQEDELRKANATNQFCAYNQFIMEVFRAL
jgi:hypothetical protein